LEGNKPFSECHLDCGSESGLFAAQTGGKRSSLRGVGETIRSLKDWVQSYTEGGNDTPFRKFRQKFSAQNGKGNLNFTPEVLRAINCDRRPASYRATEPWETGIIMADSR